MSDTPPTSPPAPRHLSPIERRITGTLLEKVLATPQSYPLTINSLLAGCNQKSNRDPEMTLSEADVARGLEALLEKRLVLLVRSEGSRTDKWRTTARDVFALGSEKGMALFAELLVRGPETLNELRRNSSRMRHELSEEEVRQILAEMASRETPLVANLGRAPGGRAERWTHTLYDEKELAELRAGSTPPLHAGAAGVGGVAHAGPGASVAASPGALAEGAPRGAEPPAEGGALAAQVAAALEEIHALARRLRVLEARVEALEGVGGGGGGEAAEDADPEIG